MSKFLLPRKFFAVALIVLALGLFGATPARAASHQLGPGRLCAGDNITLSAGDTVESLLSLGCNVSIEQGATVSGDLAAFGGNVAIAGAVGGNIASFGGNISLAETAVVNGEITHFGGNVSRAPGAVVQGGINGVGRDFGTLIRPVAPIAPIAPAAPVGPFSNVFDFGWNLVGGFITALAFAALGALVVIFAPEPTRRVGNAVQAKPLNVAGVGCLTYIVLPILMVLLIITLIGIPVALILGLAAFVAWLFGWIAIGYMTGEKILQAFKARDVLPVVAVIVGVIILTLLSQIWFVGWLVSFVGGLLGIGATVLTRFGTRAYPPAPGMMMTPIAAAAGAGPNVPGAYTPSAVDVAAWEDRARQAQARETSTPSALEVPPSAASPADTPLSDSPPTDMGGSKPIG